MDSACGGFRARRSSFFDHQTDTQLLAAPQRLGDLLYLGNRRWHDRGIEVLPFTDCVTQLDHWL